MANINISGWGDPSGFELPAQYTATTHIYILSNKVGTYDLTVQLVKVGNNEVIAQVEGTIRIRDKSGLNTALKLKMPTRFL